MEHKPFDPLENTLGAVKAQLCAHAGVPSNNVSESDGMPDGHPLQPRSNPMGDKLLLRMLLLFAEETGDPMWNVIAALTFC